MLKIRPATPEELERIERSEMEADALMSMLERRIKERGLTLEIPQKTPRKGMVIEPPKYSSSSDASDSLQNANANDRADGIETRRKLPIDRSKIRLNKERANGMVLEPPYRTGDDDAGDEG